MKYDRMTRREASTLIASTLGACLLPSKLFAENTSPLASWKVGRHLGAFQPIEKLRLEEIREAGFACLELSVTTKEVDLWEESQKSDWYAAFKEHTEKLGLVVRSIHVPFGRNRDVSATEETLREKAVEECVSFFDLKSVFGAKIYVLHPSYEPIKDEDRPRRIEQCIRSLKQLAPIAREKGVCVAVEDLPRTCLGNTAEETIRLVDAAGDPESIRICFDSNHLLKEKPEEFVAAVGNRIVTTHMSDFDGIDEKHWLPYEGVINWKAVMRELVKTGYSGPFVFETSRFKDRPATSKEMFQTWLRVREEYGGKTTET